PSHFFINLKLPKATTHVISETKKNILNFSSIWSDINVVDMHASLSHTLYLQYHWIDDIFQLVLKKFKNFPK
ncbi:hypothetical protein MXB_3696, partial [Myxobolus squamalis]